MDNKNVIIIILAIVLVVIAVGCLYFVSMPTAGDNNHVNETNITNNVTNVSQEDNQISTSGDQYGPGIYESYWSSSGPISEERIG